MKDYLSTLIYSCIIFCLALNSCEVDQAFPYNLNMPDQTIILSRNITDVAGITIDTSRTIWAINEKDPLIFSIDVLSKNTTNQITIANDSDYRGVTYLDGYVYVARNDGFLKRIAVAKNKAVKTYFNSSQSITDISGMDYDKEENRLLLVHKIRPDATAIDIYSFDLKKEKFRADIAISIPLKEVKNLMESVDVKDITFHPTALAVDPVTRQIYITLSNRYIIVAKSDGTLISIAPFANTDNGVATGLCFSKNGDLIIAFQNDNDKAKIKTFLR